MTTFGDYLRFLTGFEEFGQHDKRVNSMPNRPWFKNRSFAKLVDSGNLEEYENVWQSVGQFVHRDDILILVLLYILLGGLSRHQDKQRQVQTLLLKRLKDICVLEPRQSISSIFQEFLANVARMGQLMQNMMSELLVDPSALPELEPVHTS